MNMVAVLIAAASAFILGGIWYSPMLFGRRWSREAGVETKAPHAYKTFIISYIFSLLAAAAFSWGLGPQPPLFISLKVGFVVGLLFVGSSFGINYQFANKSLKMWLIDTGYHTLQFMLYGLIFGLWH